MEPYWGLVSIAPTELCIVDNDDHSMMDALLPYCEKKALPRYELEDSPLLILGAVHEEQMDQYATLQGWRRRKKKQKPEVKEKTVAGFMGPHPRLYNVRRAELFQFLTSDDDLQRVLLVYGGGRDLVRLYGQVHLCCLKAWKLETQLEVKYFTLCASGPNVEVMPNLPSLPASLGLDTLSDRLAGAIVVLGPTVYLAQYMQSNKPSWCTQTNDHLCSLPSNRDWGFFEFVGPKLRILFLGYRGSFWGNMAYDIASELFSLGAAELIHVGKVGSRESPLNLGRRVICPERFVLIDEHGAGKAISLENSLRCGTPFQLTGGTHATVPTVVDERLVYMEKVCSDISISTIDNEGSYFARAAAECGRMFGALYYESDYLHRRHERQVDGSSLLTKQPAPLDVVAKQLLEYFNWRQMGAPYVAVRGNDEDRASLFGRQLQAILAKKYGAFRLGPFSLDDPVERGVRLGDLNNFLQLQVRSGAPALDRNVIERDDLVCGTIVDQLYQVAPRVSLEHIWAGDHSNVILFGKAGVGKSSFCKYICFQSVQKEQSLWRDRFDVVLFLELSACSPGSNAFGLQDVAREVLAGTELESEWTMLHSWIGKHSERILLVLDGVDEVWESKEYVGLNAFLRRTLSNQTGGLPHVLMTSRPIPTLCPSPAEKWALFDILGFDVPQLRTFVDRYFHGDVKRLEQAHRLLRERPEVLQACMLPWHARLFCDVLAARKLDMGSFNVATLYHGIIDSLAAVYRKRMDRFGNNAAEWSDVKAELQRLAFWALRRHTVRILAEDWSSLRNATLSQSLIRSGLLKTIAAETHYFVHFTLLEFLAAQHLVQMQAHFNSNLQSLRLSLENSMFLRFLGDLIADDIAKQSAVMSVAVQICADTLVASSIPNRILVWNAAWKFGLDVVAELAGAWEFELSDWVRENVPPDLYDVLADCAVNNLFVAKDICDCIGADQMLQAACNVGAVDVIRFLLDEKGVNAARANLTGLGRRSLVSLIEELVEAGADLVHAVAGAAVAGTDGALEPLFASLPADKRPLVPLGMVAQAGRDAVVKQLVAKGAGVQHGTVIRGFTVSLVTFYGAKGDFDMVSFLLSHGASLYDAASGLAAGNHQPLLRSLLLDSKYDMSQLDLNLVALCGSSESLHMLLAAGAIPRQISGWTPMMSAALKGECIVMELLLQQCAELVDVAGEARWAPPPVPGRPLGFGLKVERHGQVTLTQALESTSWTPLHLAAVMGKADMVTLLCKHKANAAVGNADGWTPLNSAAHRGHLDVVRLLLSYDPSQLERPNNAGWTPLNSACEYGYHLVVGLLLQEKAVIAPEKNGATPVYVAAQNGHLECLMLLHKSGGDLTTPRSDGMKPLHAASLNGHLPIVEYLLKHKCKAKTRNRLTGVTPLHQAADRGHLGIVKSLLEKGANVNATTTAPQELTPLHFACRNGHAHVVVHLLLNGAKTHLVPHPMAMACRAGRLPVVQLLLRDCRDRKDADGLAPITHACLGRHWDVVEYLARSRANVNQSDGEGTSVLVHVARTGDLDLLRIILETADVDNVNSEGQSALHLVDNVDALRVLLEADADANVLDHEELSPMHVAALRGDDDVIELFISYGGQVDVRGPSCISALSLACEAEELDVVQCLLAKGADPNLRRTCDGLTPFHLACRTGALPLIKCIAKHTTVALNVESRSNNDATPLFSACVLNHVDVVRWLVEHGANVNGVCGERRTPLIAAVGRPLVVAKLLLDAGARVDWQDASGKTALDWARFKQERALAEVIQEYILIDENH